MSTDVQGRDELRLIGEQKVPWIFPHHSLSYAYGHTERPRHLLVQPILYMGDLQCGFGFLSTYDETIFLRQVQLASGQWIVEYSRVIYSTDTYEPSGSQGHGSGLSVSMSGPVNNQTPTAQWVVKA
ncbi:hypothetical protein N7519_008620 [Penicillium mononematosum]|uniref:uncharacterized protein n=1 Tax=Penicillium mononematosum TaxID=268346 RepID=UPI0025478206|nr:uncharacterized protein N7519_008620 [Penicillium mononematosum]KAJ6178159.1 hypothetical protein N7519_008620 [Penicillium mononematosum]